MTTRTNQLKHAFGSKQNNIDEFSDDYTFLFELKKVETIGIKLNPGISFIFSGRYLMHR